LADGDTELMLQVKAGETESFALLLERYRRPMVAYLARMVNNPAVAEELAQDVFLRVYRSRETYEPAAKFTTWLYRIATNRALNWQRDHRHAQGEYSIDRPVADQPRRLEVPDPRLSAEQESIREAVAEEVRAAVRDLPERQRLAVLMHKYEELDYNEIAAVLGCSTGAVKSMLFRAYETLRTRLSHLEENAAKCR
jgi:RNA polymerase sigma-70 factor (ECF subfamily)